MKSADIQVGKTYYVRIPRDVDEYLYMMDSGRRPRGWARERIYAEVIEIGVEREVFERTTYSGIAGTPSVITGGHKVHGGVMIRFNDGHRERVEIVPPSAIKWEQQL